ncbi:uncharacterized protein LOC122034664 [Zingiber officinale]|uniref:Uncharacterized protein n=1 Tax=Zingiber officinale TaxID=94328 RepID=A0A8J5C896_ZINOF|nr:uncharacterized protein LOC122034664 [Zingiber officinale]KAG6468017.1 hypothetical protein ZIOFF_072583 [Zingiber officinale]
MNEMKSKINGTGSIQTSHKTNYDQGNGPNWVLVIGGALLSTLSIKLGCQLKRILDNKQQEKGNKETWKSKARRSRAHQLQSDIYLFAQDEGNRSQFLSEISSGGMQSRSSLTEGADLSLPLVKVSGADTKTGEPPELLELPWKPCHHSNCSDSYFSESGSDIYTKKEVIQKLRRQLKRRDETIMEMQSQITEMQNSLHIQMAEAANLQAQINAANNDLFNSQQEVQRLRKVIADHHIGETKHWSPLHANGLVSAYPDSCDDLESHFLGVDKGKVDGVMVEMLKKETSELKEVIEGKDFLLKSYKEQKVELCSTIKELQQKLDSLVPDIL